MALKIANTKIHKSTISRVCTAKKCKKHETYQSEKYRQQAQILFISLVNRLVKFEQYT